MKTIAVILLAGNSTRFNAEIAKVFYPIKGKPLCYYSIKPFLQSSLIDEVVLVAKEMDFLFLKNLLQSEAKKIHYVIGGKERFDSVTNALKYLKANSLANDNDNILIHDGARLNVNDEQINNLIEALNTYDGATLAIKMEDTIAIRKDDEIVSFEPREQYVRIQTPQAFKFATIYEAHLDESFKATDDAQLILKLGKKIKIVAGSKKLNKITTIEDIENIKVKDDE